MPTTTPPARTPLRILDLIVGIVLLIIGALTGFVMLALIGQFSGLAEACEGVAAEGLSCDGGYLNVTLIIGTAIVVFGWFLTAGFFVVRILRRQLAFWLPIVGIVSILAAYYVVAILLQPYLAT
ncbi:MAG: DUF6264 family protein [Pseudolysinimonas sp.]